MLFPTSQLSIDCFPSCDHFHSFCPFLFQLYWWLPATYRLPDIRQPIRTKNCWKEPQEKLLVAFDESVQLQLNTIRHNSTDISAVWSVSRVFAGIEIRGNMSVFADLSLKMADPSTKISTWLYAIGLFGWTLRSVNQGTGAWEWFRSHSFLADFVGWETHDAECVKLEATMLFIFCWAVLDKDMFRFFIRGSSFFTGFALPLV
jgi:hypothetical protein